MTIKATLSLKIIELNTELGRFQICLDFEDLKTFDTYAILDSFKNA